MLALTEEASHTAAFIDEMDKLFNVFNSRTASSKAQMQHAVSESSNHKEFLTEKLKWFDDVKSKGNSRKSGNVFIQMYNIHIALKL